MIKYLLCFVVLVVPLFGLQSSFQGNRLIYTNDTLATNSLDQRSVLIDQLNTSLFIPDRLSFPDGWLHDLDVDFFDYANTTHKFDDLFDPLPLQLSDIGTMNFQVPVYVKSLYYIKKEASGLFINGNL